MLPVHGQRTTMAVGGFVNAAFSVGEDGVIVVRHDGRAAPPTSSWPKIRKIAGAKPIRYVLNITLHADHTGGKPKAGGGGRVGRRLGNFAAQVGQAAANQAPLSGRMRNVPTA